MFVSRSFASLVIFLFLFVSLFGEQNAKLVAKSKSPPSQDSIMLRKAQRLLQRLTLDPRGSASLSSKEYRELVFESPRNHTTFVLFYNDYTLCSSCQVVVESYEKIARSFLLHHTKFDKVTSTWDMQIPAFFTKVKMSEYREMMLDLDPSQPSLFYFAPSRSSKYNQFEKMELDQDSLGTEYYNTGKMLRWIEQVSDIQVILEKEKYASNTFSNLFTTILAGLVILFNIHHFGYWDYFVKSATQGNYAYFIVIIVIWLLSGQMFNYIRFTPMFGNYGFHIASLIYPGSRSQYGSESIIIMVLYAMIIYAITNLVETRERQLQENLPIMDVQSSILSSLSGFFFGFMGLQVISQMKSG